MLLQERIEELGSGILTISNSKVELIGFTCPERLYDYYNKNIDCYFSIGIYNLEPLDFSHIQNNALFIVNDRDNNTSTKYHYELIKKGVIKYKDKHNKQFAKVYYIRKCKYTRKFNYKDIDTSITFDTSENLFDYFKNRFNHYLEL